VSKQLPSILLCGYERGGTTLLSQIFRENGYVGGFEVGALMCDSPQDFLSYKPYCDMLRPGWKLGNRVTLEALCSGDFEHFYHGLVSTAFPKATAAPAFDKTPIYMSRLGFTLSQTDFINKAVVITRDPRAVFVSWAKRALSDEPKPQMIERLVRSKLAHYSKRYLDYFFGSVAHRNSSSVMFMAYEELCNNQLASIERLGVFATGCPFTLTEMTHNYKNIYGNNITVTNVTEFAQYLGPETQRMILQATACAKPFFYGECADSHMCEDDRWEQLEAKVHDRLNKFRLKPTHNNVDGLYFEPETYLLRNQDVLKKVLNPIDHFKKHGRREGRLPA